jgi:hypothetical protein
VADPVTLVHVPRGDGTGPLVGVDQTVLFRASPVRGRAVTIIGRALRVLAAAPEPNRVLVLEPFGGPRNGPRLVELDARTGEVTDDRPFPGYDPGGPWRPAELVSSPEASALLLTRPAEGARLDLALAWDRLSVRSEHAPRLVRIGSTDRLLGVAGTRILTGERRQACLEHGCPITVLTVTHDAVLTRAVQPPPGWAYGATMARGDDGDPLVVVAKVGDPSRLALARLVAGGRRGLLVGGTQGMLGSVAPVGGAQGSVVFALPRPEGVRLGVWLPGSRSAALLLDLPALEQGAQLVCACR